jgi:hypothetical protein
LIGRKKNAELKLWFGRSNPKNEKSVVSLVEKKRSEQTPQKSLVGPAGLEPATRPL